MYEGPARNWRKRLDDQVQSGLSVRQWCEQNRCCPKRFRYWRDRLTNGDAEVETGASWLPVEINSVEPTGASQLTLSVAGAQIELRPGFDPALLRAVVDALAVRPC